MNSLCSSLHELDERQLDRVVKLVASTVSASLEFDRSKDLEPQMKVFLDHLGWKKSVDVKLDQEDGTLLARLGANRHILKGNFDARTIERVIFCIFTGLGKEVFDSEVSVNAATSQFSQSLIDVTVKRIDADPMMEDSEAATDALIASGVGIASSSSGASAVSSSSSDAGVTSGLKPVTSVDDASVDLAEIFRGVFSSSPAEFIPILWDVVKEVVVLLFGDKAPGELRDAMEDASETSICVILSYLLNNVDSLAQNQNELGTLVGEFFGKGLKLKSSDKDLRKLFRKDVLVSDSSVLYRDFTARSLCGYEPGQKCTSGPRKLCDFVLHFWAGVLTELTGSPYISVNRIPAGRRQNLCIVEYSVQ